MGGMQPSNLISWSVHTTDIILKFIEIGPALLKKVDLVNEG